MTLGNAKERVLAILGEDADTEGGIELLSRMNILFDMAQKDAAGKIPVIKTKEVKLVKGVYTVEEDVRRVIALMQNGVRKDFRRLTIDIYAPDGTYIMEYIATPTTILLSSPDDTKFEVDKIAADALPYYVAAFCCLPDDTERFTHYMSIYEQKLEVFRTAVRVRSI